VHVNLHLHLHLHLHALAYTHGNGFVAPLTQICISSISSVITVPAPKVLEAPVGFDERAQRLAMMRQARQARKEEETNDLEASLSMIDNLDEDT
jgi:hypothetical protein